MRKKLAQVFMYLIIFPFTVGGLIYYLHIRRVYLVALFAFLVCYYGYMLFSKDRDKNLGLRDHNPFLNIKPASQYKPQWCKKDWNDSAKVCLLEAVMCGEFDGISEYSKIKICTNCSYTSGLKVILNVLRKST